MSSSFSDNLKNLALLFLTRKGYVYTNVGRVALTF